MGVPCGKPTYKTNLNKAVNYNVNTPETNRGTGLEGSSLVVSEKYQTRYYKVVRVDIRNSETGEVMNTETEVRLKNQELINTLTNHGVQVYYPPGDPEKKKSKPPPPIVTLEQLLLDIGKLRMATSYGGAGLTSLIEFLDQEHRVMVLKAQSFLEKGVVTFDVLWYLFEKGKQIFGFMDDEKIGTRVATIQYQRSFVPYYILTGKVIKTDGKEFYEETKTFQIPYFPRPSSLDSLPVQPMDERSLQELEERGRKFKELALGHHYVYYNGFFSRSTGFGATKFRADGRIMVDITTCNRLGGCSGFTNPHPRQNNWNQNHGGPAQLDYTLNTNLSEEQLFCTWPYLAGFSFARKRWGELLVRNVSEIEFDETAFEKLVLKRKTKNLIRALVENQNTTFRDIISDKGSGCIFLLHGPPGVGKTLTAEAVSEHLHTPLYSVSMGELGVTTTDLETRLQQILEVAAIWKATILLDEADIFLEKRSQHDIIRNAMVGIFLRLLEYHQGVLFLTTNRLNAIDDAFQSRISVAIKYKELNESARAQIWRNFLSARDLGHLDVKPFAQYQMNGRQIRNTLRLAQVMSQSEGVLLEERHILETLKMSKKWYKDFTSRGGEGSSSSTPSIYLSKYQKEIESSQSSSNNKNKNNNNNQGSYGLI